MKRTYIAPEIFFEEMEDDVMTMFAASNGIAYGDHTQDPEEEKTEPNDGKDLFPEVPGYIGGDGGGDGLWE